MNWSDNLQLNALKIIGRDYDEIEPEYGAMLIHNFPKIVFYVKINY